MISKNVIAVVLVAFAVGLVAVQSADAISPFTEIGNLADETLDALNMLGDLFNALEAVQLSEQAEQNTLESTVAALPVITSVRLTDTNSPTCVVTTPAVPSNGWCPDDLQNFFIISDVEIEETSFVSVSVSDDVDKTTRCYVNDVDEDSVRILCQPAPSDGSTLHYMIVE